MAHVTRKEGIVIKAIAGNNFRSLFNRKKRRMTRRCMIHKRRMMRRKQTRLMCVFLNFGHGHALVRITDEG